MAITKKQFLNVVPTHHVLRSALGEDYAVKGNQPAREGDNLPGPRAITIRSGNLDLRVGWQDGTGIVTELGFPMRSLNHENAAVVVVGPP